MRSRTPPLLGLVFYRTAIASRASGENTTSIRPPPWEAELLVEIRSVRAISSHPSMRHILGHDLRFRPTGGAFTNRPQGPWGSRAYPCVDQRTGRWLLRVSIKLCFGQHPIGGFRQVSGYRHRRLPAHLAVLFDPFIKLRHMPVGPFGAMDGDQVAGFHIRPLQIHIAVPRATILLLPISAFAGGRHQTGVAHQIFRLRKTPGCRRSRARSRRLRIFPTHGRLSTRLAARGSSQSFQGAHHLNSAGTLGVWADGIR
jgi:hypothetical protein